MFSAIVLDQAVKHIVSKNLAIGYGPSVIKGLFSITYVRNTGAAFGMFQGNNAIFIVISFCFISLLLFYALFRLKEDGLSMVPFSLIIAGAAGNLLDRVLRGYVVDFLDLRYFSVFNTADVMINLGVALLILEMLLKMRKRSS